MKKRQIVNIINFVRAIEPRKPEWDLLLPVKEQIKLMKEYSLRGTFLLQYDVLIRDDFMDIFKQLEQNQFEFGVWFEVVQPLVEDVGLVWTGRFPWDWHTHCGFSVGYNKEERKKLIDALYEKFKSLFGYYPRVFGSWLYDSYTLRYIEERYGADAFCDCKEQYGTDGYTLWGGYYGQGYYPSKTNWFMPAKTDESQINVPVFRMLGSDPIYQYDYKIDPQRETQPLQEVISLEPGYPGHAGSDEKWVDWYMKENFNGECLSFGYTQAGQENSFGWDRMRDGITYQFPLFARLRDEGKIEVEQFGETGRWYKQTYKETPASSIVAHTAYDDDNKNSVWYCTKNYRISLFGDAGKMRIRDLHIFSEKFADPYEDAVSTGNSATYETLPFIDGFRYTGCGVLAGGYISFEDKTEPEFSELEFVDNNDGSATVKYGDVTLNLYDNAIEITADKSFVLENRIGRDGDHMPSLRSVSDKRIDLTYKEADYSILATKGSFADRNTIVSEDNTIYLTFEV